MLLLFHSWLVFLLQCWLEVFYWSLNDSMSLEVSRTLLSILVDLNNAFVWMVLILLLISSFFSLYSKFLDSDPRAPSTVGITVTFMFYSFFFSSLSRPKYMFIFWFSFIFTRRSAGTAKSIWWQVIYPRYLILRQAFWLGLGDLCLSKNPWEFHAFHFLGRIPVCAYTVW